MPRARSTRRRARRRRRPTKRPRKPSRRRRTPRAPRPRRSRARRPRRLRPTAQSTPALAPVLPASTELLVEAAGVCVPWTFLVAVPLVFFAVLTVFAAALWVVFCAALFALSTELLALVLIDGFVPTLASAPVETAAFGAGAVAMSAAKAGRPETARMPVSASAWRVNLGLMGEGPVVVCSSRKRDVRTTGRSWPPSAITRISSRRHDAFRIAPGD